MIAARSSVPEVGDCACSGLLAVKRLLSNAPMSTRQGVRTAPVTDRLYVEVHEPTAVGTTAPTVVFCHGFGGSSRNFRPQLRALNETVRFVLYDARGHARSERRRATTTGQTFDRDALVEDLEDVIEATCDERVILGGLSMGAATALAYALEHPERVSGLLLAAYPNPSASSPSWAVKFASSIERDGMLAAGETFVWGGASRFDERAKTLIKQGFLEHSALALAAILRQFLAVLPPVGELGARLSELRIPTRIVVGADDLASVEPSRVLARLIPHANLSVLDGAGHVVNLERVTEFNEELTRLVLQVT